MKPPITHLFIAASLAFALSSAALADADKLLKKDDAWFQTDDAKERLQNIVSWQDESGSWPKNRDTSEKPFQGKSQDLSGTFDNGATRGELRVLARAYRVIRDEAYAKAFQRGLKCILATQYKNGGWPQKPRPKGYPQHITFNDGTMVGLMQFLRDVATKDEFDFVDAESRQRAKQAFDRGVACILKCQIRVDGKLTAWCAQHDKTSLEPRGARSYEHPSISGGESAGIVCLLMSLPDPSDEVNQSIRSAQRWYERSKVQGIQIERDGKTKRLVHDENASPLWARFYEIETNRPIFSGRDGIIKYEWNEIEAERRNGYSWYGNYGQRVLNGCR